MAGKSDSLSYELKEQYLEKIPPRVEITPSPTPSSVKQPPSLPIQGNSPSEGPQEDEGIAPNNMQAILVSGGGGPGDTSAATSSLETRAASRKRVRDNGEELSVVVSEGVIDQLSFKCYMYGKGFSTNRILFDHTRIHHDREWKGIEDEIIAMSPSNPEGVEKRPSKQEIEKAADEATPRFARVARDDKPQPEFARLARDVWEDIYLNKEIDHEPKSPNQEYCIPDLNLTPPPDLDRNGNNFNN